MTPLPMAPPPTMPTVLPRSSYWSWRQVQLCHSPFFTRWSIWDRRRMQASISAMVNSAVVVAFSPAELQTGMPLLLAYSRSTWL